MKNSLRRLVFCLRPPPSQVARLFSGNQPVKKGIAPIRRKSEGPDKGDQLVVHALRLVENTDRFSSDMRALEKGKVNASGIVDFIDRHLDASAR